MSMLNDPTLREAEQQLQSLQLAPLSALRASFTAPLLHQVVHEMIGHAHSYDHFLPPAAATPATPASASAATSDSLPSPVQLHALIAALRVWVQTQLQRCNAPLPMLPVESDQQDAASSSSSPPSVATAADSSASILADLAKQGCGAAEAALLLSAFRAREAELVSWARSRAVTQLSEWSLRDFDWSARVTLASSSLANLREPTLLLSLMLGAPQPSGAGQQQQGPTRKLALELSQANLDAVLEQMDKINQVVQQYSTTTDNNVLAA